MIAIAFCRKPLRALVSFRIGNWALVGRATKEGRIKTARCGRVGLMRNSAKFSTCRTHCERLAQLALFDRALCALYFRHLMRKS